MNEKNKPRRTLDECLNNSQKATNIDNLSEKTKEELKKAIEMSAEIRMAPVKQKEELEKQTETLEEAKNITAQNAEYTKQIAEYTRRNEESSNRQFQASIIVASVALLVSIITPIVQYFIPQKSIKIDEQQFNQLLNRINREEITQQQQSNQKVSTEIDSNVLIQQTVTHKMKHK